MHYPTRWDSFFRDVMILTDVYHFPTPALRVLPPAAHVASQRRQSHWLAYASATWTGTSMRPRMPAKT
jgi:hypothetical protein